MAAKTNIRQNQKFYQDNCKIDANFYTYLFSEYLWFYGH